MNKSICHITTLHPRYDVRIFHKECKSLAKKYDVNLIVADGLGNELIDNVNIHDIGRKQNSRLKRAFLDSKKALNMALSIDAEVYHFHDPELINIGIKLLKRGKKVIYDVHEDLPRQVFGKPYISTLLKPLISKLIEWQENKNAKKLSYICAATPFIKDRFLKVNPNTVDINNYPILNLLEQKTDYLSREQSICYVGGISKNRGVFELIESLKYSKIKLQLAGDFEDPIFEEKCRRSEGWKQVEFHGYISRKEILVILNKSKIGIVTLHPLINYLDSLPVKMFEYMEAGIPVICSNFPYWENIIKVNNIGLSVDPLSPKKISEATLELINNPERSSNMGNNGRRTVIEKFNWGNEEAKLFSVYQSLTNKDLSF